VATFELLIGNDLRSRNYGLGRHSDGHYLCGDRRSRDSDSNVEHTHVITMFVPPKSAALTPGPLVITQSEADERYTERSALMDVLFSIPDCE